MIAQHRVIWWLCHHLFSMRQTYLEPHFNGLKPGLRCPCVLQCNSMASRMSRLLILLLVSLCVPSSESLKVFSFERTQEAGDNSSSLTFATLDSTTTEALPPRFRCPIVSSSSSATKVSFLLCYCLLYLFSCVGQLVSRSLYLRLRAKMWQNKASSSLSSDLCCAGLTSRAPGTRGGFSTCMATNINPGLQSGSAASCICRLKIWWNMWDTHL